MATFKKTLTMSQINDMPVRETLSVEDALVLSDIENGKVGYLQKAIWNNMPIWNNVDVMKSTLSGQPIYLSASIMIDDATNNRLLHSVTPYIGTSNNITPTIDYVLNNVIALQQLCTIDCLHLGDDLWQTTCRVDFRQVSETLFDTFEDLLGKDRTIVKFGNDTIIEEFMAFGTVYEATKTFTWDKISNLSWTFQTLSQHDGGIDEIISYTIS